MIITQIKYRIKLHADEIFIIFIQSYNLIITSITYNIELQSENNNTVKYNIELHTGNKIN